MRTIENLKLPFPQTRKSAHLYFREHGICISHWAEDMGFTRDVVMGVLRGSIKGHHGRAHHAAIALGIKKNPEVKNDK